MVFLSMSKEKLEVLESLGRIVNCNPIPRRIGGQMGETRMWILSLSVITK